MSQPLGLRQLNEPRGVFAGKHVRKDHGSGPSWVNSINPQLHLCTLALEQLASIFLGTLLRYLET